jgi:hypothetical protein
MTVWMIASAGLFSCGDDSSSSAGDSSADAAEFAFRRLAPGEPGAVCFQFRLRTAPEPDDVICHSGEVKISLTGYHAEPSGAGWLYGVAREPALTVRVTFDDGSMDVANVDEELFALYVPAGRKLAELVSLKDEQVVGRCFKGNPDAVSPHDQLDCPPGQ